MTYLTIFLSNSPNRMENKLRFENVSSVFESEGRLHFDYVSKSTEIPCEAVFQLSGMFGYTVTKEAE